MNAISTPEPVSINRLRPDEEDLLTRVVDALKDWDHEAAREPWSLLIESRTRSTGAPGDRDIKHLIWMALRRACLTCASRDESEYLRLVQDLANVDEDAQVTDLDLEIPVEKQQELAQMVFTISKKLYDMALAVISEIGGVKA